jgi:hypothetical protein
VAKGQVKTNREMTTPRQDEKTVTVTPPPASPFASLAPPGNPAQKGVPKNRRSHFSARFPRG